jgi:threonine dehydrogenase-like Zn-dependent dehydrogenase
MMLLSISYTAESVTLIYIKLVMNGKLPNTQWFLGNVFMIFNTASHQIARQKEYMPRSSCSILIYSQFYFCSHEIVGIVVEVGSEVKNFSAGDRVGVACMVGSCHHCDSCSKGQEQYCEKVIWTYGSTDVDGSVTFGGYSYLMVCNQR